MKKDTKKMKRGAGRVAFLAEREAIAALVIQGIRCGLFLIATKAALASAIRNSLDM